MFAALTCKSVASIFAAVTAFASNLSVVMAPDEISFAVIVPAAIWVAVTELVIIEPPSIIVVLESLDTSPVITVPSTLFCCSTEYK